MIINIGKKELSWALVSQFFHATSNLLILPIILISLSELELAYWYIFLAISGFSILLDFGFQSVIQKYFTYALSGCERIDKNGISQIKDDASCNQQLLACIVDVSKNIYRKISFIVFIFMLTFGSIYLSVNFDMSESNLILSWLIFSISIYLSVKYAYYKPMMRGLGYIVETHKSIVISKIIYFISVIFSIYIFDFGILGLCISHFISNIFLRAYNYLQMKRSEYDEMISKKVFHHDVVTYYEVRDSIWYNSKKNGIILICDYIFYRYVVLISPFFFDEKIVASLGVSMQIMLALKIFSNTFVNVNLPKYSMLIVHDNSKKMIELFKNNFIKTTYIYMLGVVILLSFGHFFLGLINSNSNLLSIIPLLLISIYLYFDLIYKNSTLIISLYNVYPYVFSSIIISVFILVFVPILIYYSKSLNFTFLFMIILQLTYNTWYWPKYLKGIAFNGYNK